MKFEEAAEAVKSLTQCSDNDKLILYSLYKQSTVGDVNIAKPSALNIEAHAKWCAWEKVKGTKQLLLKYPSKRYVERGCEGQIC